MQLQYIFFFFRHLSTTTTTIACVLILTELGDVARLAPEPVMLALRMGAGSPSAVPNDGLRRRDACLEAARRLKCVGEVGEALLLLQRSTLKGAHVAEAAALGLSGTSKKSGGGALDDAAGGSAAYNTSLVPGPVAAWADDGEVWAELGCCYEAFGRYLEAAEAFGRVKETAPEYGVAEKGARECGAIATQRAVLQTLSDAKRAKAGDPAANLCPVPQGCVRLCIPEPPGLGGKVPSRAKLACVPKRKLRFISAVVWLPTPDTQNKPTSKEEELTRRLDKAKLQVEIAEAKAEAAEEGRLLEEAETANRAGEDTEKKDAERRDKRASVLDDLQGFAVTGWAAMQDAASEAEKLSLEANKRVALSTGVDLNAQANSLAAQAGEAGKAAAKNSGADGALADAVGNLDSFVAATTLSSNSDNLGGLYDDAPAGEAAPPLLPCRMPGLPPGWVAVVPLYGDVPTSPVGSDQPKSATPLFGSDARVFFYHAGLHLTLRSKPEGDPANTSLGSGSAYTAENVANGVGQEMILREDEAGMRAVQLSRYRAYASKEGLDLPPQRAVAEALRFDLRRFSAARTGTVLPPPTRGVSALSAAAGSSSSSKGKKSGGKKAVFGNLVLGAFQPPFADFDVTFDAEFDLPLLLKIKGAALPANLNSSLPRSNRGGGSSASNDDDVSGEGTGGETSESATPSTNHSSTLAGGASHWLFVTGFAPGDGAAERSGKIKALDLLLSVNGKALRGKQFEKAVKLIASQPREGSLVLRFRRSLVLHPPFHPGDPGSVAPTEDMEEELEALAKAASEGVKSGLVLARRGEAAEGAAEEGKFVFAELARQVSTRTKPLPPLANLPFPPPRVIEAVGQHYQTQSATERGSKNAFEDADGSAAVASSASTSSSAVGLSALSTSAEHTPVVEGWVNWCTVDGVALQSLPTVLKQSWVGDLAPAAAAAAAGGSPRPGGGQKAALLRSLSDDPPRVYLTLRRDTKLLAVSRPSPSGGGVGCAFEGGWDMSPGNGRLKLIEVCMDPSVRGGNESKDGGGSGGGSVQFGPLPWQVWLTCRRSDLLKDINDAASAAAAASARNRGGTGLVLKNSAAGDNEGGEGDDDDGLEKSFLSPVAGGVGGQGGGVYAPITVGWDSLGDPYGGNAKVVVLCFPSELEAVTWAEALATVNVSALKTTRPRRLKERAQPPQQQQSAGGGGAAAAAVDAGAVPGAAAALAAERRKAAAAQAEAEALVRIRLLHSLILTHSLIPLDPVIYLLTPSLHFSSIHLPVCFSRSSGEPNHVRQEPGGARPQGSHLGAPARDGAPPPRQSHALEAERGGVPRAQRRRGGEEGGGGDAIQKVGSEEVRGAHVGSGDGVHSPERESRRRRGLQAGLANECVHPFSFMTRYFFYSFKNSRQCALVRSPTPTHSFVEP